MLRRVVGEQIALRLQLDPALGLVLADPGQLEQVIANLGVNAPRRHARRRHAHHRAPPTWTRPTSRAAPGGDRPLLGPLVALTVSDTGIGMDEHALAHLFEPFFTTKELGRGTGLGLATVYGIVRQSGGHIQVASRLREGSTFTRLPPARRGLGRTCATARHREPTRAARRPETVLVVEDEDAVRHLVCRVLRGKGYRVLEARRAGGRRSGCAEHTASRSTCWSPTS